MSSVMRPSGPEPQQTYWMRRAAVVIGAIVALALVGWVLSSLFGGSGTKGSTVSATPQNNPSLAVDPALSSTPTATPTAVASSTASTSPSAAASSASASASASHSASASATPSKSSASPTPSAPVTCDPNALKLVLAGDPSLKIGQSTTYTVTVTNTGSASCILKLDGNALSLRITSGSDHIWSSGDCASWGLSGSRTVAPGKSVVWRPTWTTQRSTGTCTLSKTTLGAGTYRAVASLGDLSDHLVMTLHS